MIDPTTCHRKSYSIKEIADKFNKLSDIRAIYTISRYPSRLYGDEALETIQELGFLFVDAEECSGRVFVTEKPNVPAMTTKRFGVLYVNIYNTSRKNWHSNLVLVDNVKRTVERFEPHGSDQSMSPQGTDFRNFYDPLALDHLLVSVVTPQNYLYIAPPKEYPVMGQSLSRNDSHMNTSPYPGAFKRMGQNTHGDSFCSAWTVYYLLLRTNNPDTPMLEVYEYLLGLKNQLKTIRMFHMQDYNTDANIFLGRTAADTISGFINFAYSRYETLFNDESIRQAISQLDA